MINFFEKVYLHDEKNIHIITKNKEIWTTDRKRENFCVLFLYCDALISHIFSILSGGH